MSPRILSSLSVLLFFAFPCAARAEVQTLTIGSTGWHFVSLALKPTASDPASVFPLDSGFTYDHIWSYDPVDGWRHFSPSVGTPLAANDLTVIQPLRGYWIHVTAAPVGGISILVSGERVHSTRLVPRLTQLDAWHSIGPLLPTGRSSASVATVFAALGAAFGSTLQEVWRFDQPTGQLFKIESNTFGAVCPSAPPAPTACLVDGAAYWVRANGVVALGANMSLSSRGVVLTADNPASLLEIGYEGTGPVAARIRAVTTGSGLMFHGARTEIVDGIEYPSVDLDSNGDAAASFDYDGDGAADADEPCPDLCGAATDCANVCFNGPGRKHQLYVTMLLSKMSEIEQFSSLVEGREYGSLVLEVRPTGPGGVVGGAFDVAGTVKVAVKPPVLRGIYTGTLEYASTGASVPLTLWLDDCTISKATGAEDCSGSRATALLNPTVTGSKTNGLDDDGDGIVDDDSEDGKAIPIRENPGVPPETVLRGSISAGNQVLTLIGTTFASADLAFAAPRETCDGGICPSTGISCVRSEECAPPDAGLAAAFSNASRELSLVAQRTSVEQFVGSFSERVSNASLGTNVTADATGLFELTRVVAPQCVSPGAPGESSRALDVACRSNSDCPGSCVGPTAIQGFSCVDDTQCVGVNPLGQTISGTCQRFICGFRKPATGSASQRAFEVANRGIQIQSLDRDASVELEGPVPSLGQATSLQSTIGFADLVCGTYAARIRASNCAERSVTFDPCSGGTAPIVVAPLDCSGPPIVIGSTSPTSSGGAFTLTGGVSLTAPITLAGGSGSSTLTLRGSAGEVAVAGRDPVARWSNVMSWPGLLAVLRTGLQEVF